MAFPIIRHEDPGKLRMAFEANSHQIEIFALVPVGRGPYRRNGMYERITASEAHFQAQPFATIERKQVVIHFEAWLEREAVQGGDVRQKGKMKRRFGRQIRSSSQEMFAGYYDRCFAAELDHLSYRQRVPHPQSLDYPFFVRFL